MASVTTGTGVASADPGRGLVIAGSSAMCGAGLTAGAVGAMEYFNIAGLGDSVYQARMAIRDGVIGVQEAFGVADHRLLDQMNAAAVAFAVPLAVAGTVVTVGSCIFAASELDNVLNSVHMTKVTTPLD